MVLMSVDLPQPFGPRIATCSPASTRRLKSSSATLSPRMTRTFFSQVHHNLSPRVFALGIVRRIHGREDGLFQFRDSWRLSIEQRSGFSAYRVAMTLYECG